MTATADPTKGARKWVDQFAFDRLRTMADHGRIDAAYGNFSHPALTMIDDVRKVLPALTEAASQPREGEGLAPLDQVADDIGLIDYLAANDSHTRHFRHSLAGAASRIRSALTQRPPEQAGAVEMEVFGVDPWEDEPVTGPHEQRLRDQRKIAPAVSGEIPAGMVAWHGGDNAPTDWDGGRVLFRHGGTSTSRPGEGMDWRHFTGVVTDGRTDIIAYTPKASAETGEQL